MNRRFLSVLTRGAASRLSSTTSSRFTTPLSTVSISQTGVLHAFRNQSSSPGNNRGQLGTQSVGRSTPMCEWSRIHETDPSQGFLFRSVYQNGNVHLLYFPQNITRDQKRANSERRPDGSSPLMSAFSLVDKIKRINLILPTPFICRLLAVLEGTLPSVTLATRSTQGTFSGDLSKFTFQLSCSSVYPDGTELSWKMDFDPGESIMLQRFLMMALERNFGFEKYKEVQRTLRPGRSSPRTPKPEANKSEESDTEH
mmetsp:Transcript_23660/g.32290  ORF Transcript_23660/g.32290 Transcript_23660/m.32290 type:complete len:255 (+) Transcript_23660:58-822(+)